MDSHHLDTLAGELYGLVFNRVIHKLDQKEKRKQLAEQISRLTGDEKAYIKKWVIEAFELLRQKYEKKI